MKRILLYLFLHLRQAHFHCSPFSSLRSCITLQSRTTAEKTNTAVLEEATADGITVKVEANATPEKKPKRCRLKPDDYKISPALEVVAAATMMGPVDPPPTPNIGQVADDENFANHEPPVPLCITTDWTAKFEAAVVAWADKNGY